MQQSAGMSMQHTTQGQGSSQDITRIAREMQDIARMNEQIATM